jgi:hypothetical protein
MNTELKTQRGRSFFWIGLFVFPVFWVWWMNALYFTRRQILAAWLWTVLYMVAIGTAWFVFPSVRARVVELRWTYSHIAFYIGAALWIWLLFRATPVGNYFRISSPWKIIVGVIMTMDCAAIMFSMLSPTLHVIESKIQPHPMGLLFVIIPAVAHLLVEPFRRWREHLTAHKNQK